MKIIDFAYDKSPFMIELMEAVASKLPDRSEFIYVSKIQLNSDRAHWKLKTTSKIRFEGLPTNIPEFLKNENPDIIIYVGYRGRRFQTIKNWCNANSKKFFVWAGERLMEYNISHGHFKRHNRLFVWLKYRLFEFNTKNVNGLIACGNRASYLYQENTNNMIPVINVPYVFDLSDMLSKERKPFDGKNLIFLISGRLLEFRDPLHSVKLFSQLIPLLPNMNLRLIVSGLGPLYQDIKDLVAELKIEDKVTYENDFKDWYDIRKIYYHSHVLLCMYPYNGWSLTIQESMAAGQFVVATNSIDGADQLIINGFNGLLVHKPSNIDTLNEILNVITNKEHFEKCRSNARESVKSIDLDIISSRLVNFLFNN